MGVFTDAIGGSRYVVVVRREDEGTYEYLKTRVGRLKGVEVMLDRRHDSDNATGVDRRRAPARFNSFGVLLARR